MNTQLFQLLLSLFAILLLALLAKIYWPKDWILDKDRVRRAFERSDYDITIRDIWLNTSNTAALIQLDSNKIIGYAFVFGDRVTCRTLGADDIKSVHYMETHLDVAFHDYTLNALSFNFCDSASCKAALEALTILKPINEVHP
jgi:hypothetical protein